MNGANLNRQVCKKQQKKWFSQLNKSVAFVTVAPTNIRSNGYLYTDITGISILYGRFGYQFI
jgi:hypothetical protein